MAKPIQGTKNSDSLQGTAAANNLLALGGGDTLNGLQGNDLINGGTGVDIALYSGAFADYTFDRHGNGNIKITDKRPDGDGTDKLVNVELLQFSDVTIDARTGAVVGAAAENIVVVHDDGTFTSADSLAAAVELATHGETIFIGSGTYDVGSVAINEDLTIIGTDDTIINGGFYIGAGGDGTTIDNVTINGGAPVVGEAGMVGVFVQADDVTITNSTFNGDGTDGTADRGIVTSIADAQGLVISDNTFTGWDTGVYLNPGTDAQVTDNTFENNFVGLSADQDATSDVSITENTFSNSVFEQVGFGVMGAGNTEDVGAQVADNTFVGTAPEVSVYLLASNQNVTLSEADDTIVYTDPDPLTNETWMVSDFQATDQIDLNGAGFVADDTSADVVLTLGTGDEIQLVGVDTFDPNWIVA